jgi:hypothetical protein
MEQNSKQYFKHVYDDSPKAPKFWTHACCSPEFIVKWAILYPWKIMNIWHHLHWYGEVSCIGSVILNKISESQCKVSTDFNDNILRFEMKIAEQTTKMWVLIQIRKETSNMSVLTEVCFHYYYPSPLIDLVSLL